MDHVIAPPEPGPRPQPPPRPTPTPTPMPKPPSPKETFETDLNKLTKPTLSNYWETPSPKKQLSPRKPSVLDLNQFNPNNMKISDEQGNLIFSPSKKSPPKTEIKKKKSWFKLWG